jgi:hypothetical protein
MVFAVAKNLEAAKKLACSQAAKWFTYGQYEEDQREWTYPLGDPIRIVDLPCAEWHEWSE